MATKSFRMTNHVPRNSRVGDVNDRNNSADAIVGIPPSGLEVRIGLGPRATMTPEMRAAGAWRADR